MGRSQSCVVNLTKMIKLSRRPPPPPKKKKEKKKETHPPKNTHKTHPFTHRLSMQSGNITHSNTDRLAVVINPIL